MSGIPPGSCLCSTGSRLSSWWRLQWGPARSDWAQAHPSMCKPPWWVQVGAESNRYVITGGEPQWETQLKPTQQLEPNRGNRFLFEAFILDFLKIGKLICCQVAFYDDGGVQLKLLEHCGQCCLLSGFFKYFYKSISCWKENRWEKKSWSEIMIAVALQSIFSVEMKTFYQLTRMLSRTLLNSRGSSFPSMAAGSSPSPP